MKNIYSTLSKIDLTFLVEKSEAFYAYWELRSTPLRPFLIYLREGMGCVGAIFDFWERPLTIFFHCLGLVFDTFFLTAHCEKNLFLLWGAGL